MNAAPEETEQPRLLIVDDDRDLLRSLSVRFRSWGFQVAAETDGATAIEKAGTFAPDAVLLDLRMPNMDGFQLLEKLAEKPETAAVPKLVLSANIADQARSVALALGACGFLTKPFDSKTLLAAVMAVLPRFVRQNI